MNLFIDSYKKYESLNELPGMFIWPLEVIQVYEVKNYLYVLELEQKW